MGSKVKFVVMSYFPVLQGNRQFLATVVERIQRAEETVELADTPGFVKKSFVFQF